MKTLLQQVIALAEVKPGLYRENFSTLIAYRCAVASSGEQMRRFRELQKQAGQIDLPDVCIRRALETWSPEDTEGFCLQGDVLLLSGEKMHNGVMRRYFLADLLAKSLAIADEEPTLRIVGTPPDGQEKNT